MVGNSFERMIYWVPRDGGQPVTTTETWFCVDPAHPAAVAVEGQPDDTRWVRASSGVIADADAVAEAVYGKALTEWETADARRAAADAEEAAQVDAARRTAAESGRAKLAALGLTDAEITAIFHGVTA